MELNNDGMRRIFTIHDFKSSYLFTWLCCGAGMFAFLIFLFFSGMAAPKRLPSNLIQNAGLFFMINCVLTAYLGACMRISMPDERMGVWRCARASFRRIHYLLAISCGAVLCMVAVFLVEAGISLISHIPYAGPIIMIILTIPLFMINVLLIMAVPAALVVAPPVIADAGSFRDGMSRLALHFRKRAVHTILFTVLFLFAFFVGTIFIYYVIKYAGGVTRAVHWNISAAYPKMVNVMSAPSLFSDIVSTVAPAPSPLSALREYGTQALKLADAVKYAVGFIYIVAYSLVVSLLLTAHFHGAARLYRLLFKDDKSEAQ